MKKLGPPTPETVKGLCMSCSIKKINAKNAPKPVDVDSKKLEEDVEAADVNTKTDSEDEEAVSGGVADEDGTDVVECFS